MNSPLTPKKPSILLKVFIAFILLIGAFLIVVATRPAEYRVTRSATMAAPASAVFPQVNDLQKFNSWSPWAKIDPNAKYTFAGPASGKGASLAWTGNNEVGEGKMTITESRPNDLIRFHLEFYKPMSGTSETEFTFKPEGNQTAVTWTMTGRNNFIAKAMCMFMDMDKMVGGQFEQGLASMKSIVEGAPKP
ncbi:MAG TPA: SRPBCC family protein [Verrucomicrobiae bacterium]|nr:SRPBCC family protein [Verrucomicrobiae bacterium]